MQNPSDLDATYDGKKGQGYQVQFSETCTDGNDVQLIVSALPQTAVESDANALVPVLEDLQERDLLTLVDADGTLHHHRWLENASLNESNAEVLVTMLEYWEIPPKGSKKPLRHFSWVTDLTGREDTVAVLVRGGRARWHIENETFNTLKNQGYYFDHNFGHGAKNLSVVFALLMMLAFLVDQTMQLCDVLFQAALKQVGRKCRFREKIRSLFETCHLTSMCQVYELLRSKYKATPPSAADSS